MFSTKKPQPHKIPLFQAVLWIVLSTLLISGSAISAFFYYQHIRAKRFHDERFRVVALIQSTPDKEGLKTAYLAELLDLSIDRPSNLYKLNTKKLQQRLMTCPVIKSGEIKRIPPGTVGVEYIMRKPVAYLGEYTNTAIDEHGVVFPFKPFFTPKNLPEIYAGFSALEHSSEEANDLGNWGVPIQTPRLLLALDILRFLNEHYASETHPIRKIDVTRAYSLSYGQREVVVIMEKWIQLEKEGKQVLALSPRILRLNTESYASGISRYAAMENFLKKEEEKRCKALADSVIKLAPIVIDLRLPQLAYLSIPDPVLHLSMTAEEKAGCCDGPNSQVRDGTYFLQSIAYKKHYLRQ